MPKATLRTVLVLNAYWVGLSFMWNSLHVIILPAVLLHLVPDAYKNTYLGLLTFLGLVIAMLVQPISGAISDRWPSRWGKRRPLTLLGTLFDFLFLGLLAYSGGLGWLALGYIGLQFSSNIAHGPLQGMLPDQVPPEQLGWASGFKNLADMAGLVVSSLLVGRLMTDDTRYPVAVVGLVAAVLAVSAFITIAGVRERPYVPSSTRPGFGWRDAWQAAVSAFQVDLRAHSSFAWLVASRFLFLAGIYGIQSFAQYFVRDVLRVPDPIRLTGDLLAAITLTLIACALLAGGLGDRVGHRRVSLLASLIGAAGCLLLMLARSPAALLVFGSVVGAGIGLFLTANWALANELAPSEQAGKFMGLTNLATAGAGMFGRLEGPMIDVLNHARPGAWWGYTALFLLGAVSILLSAVLLRQVKEAPNKRLA